jgi:hypothetical protein
VYPFFFNLRIQETSGFGPLMISKTTEPLVPSFWKLFKELAVLRIPILEVGSSIPKQNLLHSEQTLPFSADWGCRQNKTISSTWWG